MKYSILPLSLLCVLVIISLALMSYWGSATVCANYSENYKINVSETIADGATCILNLNDSDNNGVITFGANNILFDCNGTSLNGKGIANSRGIVISGVQNITIKNCILSNYSYAIRGGVANTSINNNNLINNSYAFYIACAGDLKANSVYSNNIINNSNVYICGIQFFNLSNNIFNGLGNGSKGIVVTQSGSDYYDYFENNILYNTNTHFEGLYTPKIKNNSYYNSKCGSGVFALCGLTLNANHGSDVQNNYFDGSSTGLLQSRCGDTGAYIANNRLTNADWGIDIDGRDCAWPRNSYIFNNTIYNITGLNDDYNNCFRLEYGADNITLANNNCSYYGTGALIRHVSNITLHNNIWYQYPDDLVNSQGLFNKLEPPSGISIVEIYKNWYGDAKEL